MVIKKKQGNEKLYRAGYRDAIEEMKIIFQKAQEYDPKMKPLDIIADWQKIYENI
jgi:hypothetical protein